MTAIYVLDHKFWEELANQGQDIVCDIVAFGATNNQCRTIEMIHIWVFVWKVAHVVETGREYIHGNTKFKMMSICCAYKVRQEELTDGELLREPQSVS